MQAVSLQSQVREVGRIYRSYLPRGLFVSEDEDENADESIQGSGSSQLVDRVRKEKERRECALDVCMCIYMERDGR